MREYPDCSVTRIVSVVFHRHQPFRPVVIFCLRHTMLVLLGAVIVSIYHQLTSLNMFYPGLARALFSEPVQRLRIAVLSN